MALDMSSSRKAYVLPVIVLSQFCGTALWFTGNAVSEELGLGENAAFAASAVQLGFIVGTLVSARLRLSDRYPAPALFLICCLAGALFNYPFTEIAQTWDEYLVPGTLAMRFAVGVTLAGIYPVGIKVAASWYREGLGNALGYLIGALVLGTAFPHLIKGLGTNVPYEIVLATTSAVAIFGGLILWRCVAEGPCINKGSIKPQSLQVPEKLNSRLQASACGYFGHMWELYGFWAFVPLFLNAHLSFRHAAPTNESLWLFVIIASGALGCIYGGAISRRRGSAPVALIQLSISGLCCLLSPVAFYLPTSLLLCFLVIWGITVVGDSPQFSALIAVNAPSVTTGSVITMVNCIGFSITIVSVQVLGILESFIEPRYIMWPLTFGPLIGAALFARGYIYRTIK